MIFITTKFKNGHNNMLHRSRGK